MEAQENLTSEKETAVEWILILMNPNCHNGQSQIVSHILARIRLKSNDSSEFHGWETCNRYDKTAALGHPKRRLARF